MSAKPGADRPHLQPAWFAGRWWLLVLWLLPVLGALWTVCRAPAWLEPHLLRVTLEPDRTVTLGREALWAPQADNEHILLRRDMVGGWRLANIATGKQVLWRPAGANDDRPVREWPLMPGAAFAVGAQTFTVLVADADRLVLQSDGRRWEYDGIRLRRDGQPLPECLPEWRRYWRAWSGELNWPRGLLERPLRLGGGVYCADRLGLAETPVDTAIIQPTRAGFVLYPGSAGRPDGPPVTVAAGMPDAESLWRRSIPLAVGDRLIVGRTHYRVTRTAPVLELAVIARAQRRLAGSPPPTVAPMVTVAWRPLAWLWPSNLRIQDWWLGLALSPLALGLIGSGRRRLGWPTIRGRWPMALALALTGICLALHLNRLTVPVLWPYLLAWPALLVWLGTVRSPWSARLLAVLTVLLGGGLVTLLQLGTGAGESGWLRHGGSGAALAGAFGWLAWAGWTGRQAWPAGGLDWRWARWGLRLLGAAALTLLALQVMFGDEGGWSGLQPFELTKLALTAAAAHALMSRLRSGERDWRSGQSSPWPGYLGPLALLLAASGFALAFLRDFSPLALLLPWGLALAWAYLSVHPRPVRRGFGRLAVFVLVLLFAAGLAWLHDRPERFPLDFQADRIRVWAAPEQYPHAGYQLRRALEAIRAGGWWGTAWREAGNGQVMAIPAVENDFTPAFFLNRYGGLAALALVGAQAAFMAIMLTIAQRALKRTGCGDDHRVTALGGFAYFALYGGAALLGAHFLVSWGTNLGFLPVMGQPMSLLSAAGSHLVLFVLPIVALAVAVEEKNHDNPL